MNLPVFAPDAAEIRAELSQVLAFSDFVASPQLTGFLKYVVDQSLEGNSHNLKERNIAVKALHRDSDFDPRLDCVVRVVAGRLRRALERFYATDGADRPLQIELPKGGYRPAFVTTNYASSGPTMPSQKNGDCSEPQVAPPVGPFPVIVVLPCVIFEHDDRARIIADTIAQDISAQLSKFSWVEVVDFLVARSLCGVTYKPLNVASKLHSDFCLSGTIRKHNEAYRLTVQVTDAHRGTLIVADQFDIPVVDGRLIDLDEIVEKIVLHVGDIFGALASVVYARSQRKSDHELTLIEAVLTALDYDRHASDFRHPAALKAAKRATEADPECPWGWATLAYLHLDAASQNAKAKCNATKELENAATCIMNAQKTDPTCAYAHWTMSYYHIVRGRPDEAISAAELAVDLAHGSPFEIGAAGVAVSAAGNYQRGQALIDQALEINPSLPGWIHWGTAVSAFGRGDLDLALATTEKFSLPGMFWDHVFRAAALHETGETKSAKKSLRKARKMRPSISEKPRELIGKLILEPELQDRLLQNLESIS